MSVLRTTAVQAEALAVSAAVQTAGTRSSGNNADTIPAARHRPSSSSRRSRRSSNRRCPSASIMSTDISSGSKNDQSSIHRLTFGGTRHDMTSLFQLSPGDAEACFNIELVQWMKPNNLGPPTTILGLQCRNCARWMTKEEKHVLTPSSVNRRLFVGQDNKTSSHQKKKTKKKNWVLYPPSVDHVWICIRQLAHQHVLHCPRTPLRVRDAIWSSLLWLEHEGGTAWTTHHTSVLTAPTTPLQPPVPPPPPEAASSGLEASVHTTSTSSSGGTPPPASSQLQCTYLCRRLQAYCGFRCYELGLLDSRVHAAVQHLEAYSATIRLEDSYFSTDDDDEDSNISNDQERGPQRVLIGEDDRPLVTDFVYYALQQFRPCSWNMLLSERLRRQQQEQEEHLPYHQEYESPSSSPESTCRCRPRTSSMAVITSGWGGLQCRQCAKAESSSPSRQRPCSFYYASPADLKQSAAEFLNHAWSCSFCPAETRNALLLLRSIQKPPGARTVFWQRLWDRLVHPESARIDTSWQDDDDDDDDDDTDDDYY